MTRTLCTLALLLSACGDKTDDARPDDLSDCSASDAPGPEVDVGELSIDGDTLSIEVSFGGGCEEHTLALCWPEQAFLEEDPAQALLEVWHDGNEDSCEAYLTEILVVDLTPLKTAWQDGYGAESGTIQLTVGDSSLEYRF